MASAPQFGRVSLLLALLGVGHVFSDKVYVETGKNCTLKPVLKGKPEKNILWKYGTNKLVEYEGGDLDWYQFKGRGELDFGTGDLTLRELTKGDSGHYQSEIQVLGKLQYSDHEVTVLDPVSIPEVRCIKNDEGEVTSLHCSLNAQIQAEFEWTGPGEMKNTGATLQVSNVTELNTLYYCIAKNQVSQQSKEFSLGACYSGGRDGGSNTVAIIVPIVLGLIAISAAVVAFVICKKKEICHRYRVVNTGGAGFDLPMKDKEVDENSDLPENDKKVDENRTADEKPNSDDKDYINVKSEDEPNTVIKIDNHGSGEGEEDDKDYINVKSEDEPNTVIKFDDLDSGEGEEGQGQTQNASFSADISPPSDDNGDS